MQLQIHFAEVLMCSIPFSIYLFEKLSNIRSIFSFRTKLFIIRLNTVDNSSFWFISFPNYCFGGRTFMIVLKQHILFDRRDIYVDCWSISYSNNWIDNRKPFLVYIINIFCVTNIWIEFKYTQNTVPYLHISKSDGKQYCGLIWHSKTISIFLQSGIISDDRQKSSSKWNHI